MIFNILKNLPHTLRLVTSHSKSLIQLKRIEKTNGCVGKLFDEYAKKHPDKICFYFEDQKWSFQKVYETSNRIGNFFAKQGLNKNDRVALIMDNRPEYVCMWLGLSKIGVVPALINFNLRQAPLKHCIEISNPKTIICGYEFSEAVEEIYPKGGTKVPLYGTGIGDRGVLKDAIDLDARIDSSLSIETPTISKSVGFLDPLFFIYTSGTTGLPKAAVIRHSRFLMAAIAGSNIYPTYEDDILYTTLPLYHTASGVLACSQTLIRGSTLVLRQKFSAKHFWKDCIKHKVTGAQYMGETCRYLLRQPPSPEDKQHDVRLMFGNGLRAEIWEEFVNRFNIKQITETYGSTEGNANFVNFTGRVGSVGFIPPFLKTFLPFAVVKLDENGKPIRDAKTGLIEQCKENEPGELVSIIKIGHPFKDFTGYAENASATNKKIIEGVFKKGDTAFRTGDLFTKDRDGHYYFKDRMGDTFRWKSENVSTTEVEYVISNSAGLRDVVVFGVKIPDTDGQAGMAVIADPNHSLDLNQMTQGILNSLPSYAIPLFLRISNEIEITGTYKMKKTDLQNDGYAITVTNQKDRIYFFLNKAYVPLTNEIYEKIISGHIRL